MLTNHRVMSWRAQHYIKQPKTDWKEACLAVELNSSNLISLKIKTIVIITQHNTISTKLLEIRGF